MTRSIHAELSAVIAITINHLKGQARDTHSAAHALHLDATAENRESAASELYRMGALISLAVGLCDEIGNEYEDHWHAKGLARAIAEGIEAVDDVSSVLADCAR